MATQTETVVLDFQVDTTEAVTSIESLTKANKALREERKALDVTTKDGKARIDEINKSLDANNKTIKENSSALEKSRLNVGNYTSALDKMVPGLGSMAQGFVNGTKAALAFIATPIGAVITALGLAISALTSYFKGSEEGQNAWNKIIAVGSALLEKFMDIVEGVGELVFRVFTEPQKVIQQFIDLISKDLSDSFKSLQLIFQGFIERDFGKMRKGFLLGADVIVRGVERMKKGVLEWVDSIGEAIEAGKELADLNAEIDRSERELIVQRAETQLAVSKLRSEAIKLEGEEKRNALIAAIELETQLSDAEVAHAELKLQLATQEAELNGATKEALEKIATATAGVATAEASRFEKTLKMSKEIEALDNAEANRRKKMSEDNISLLLKSTQKSIEISKAGLKSRTEDEERLQNTVKTTGDVQDSTGKAIMGSYTAVSGAFQAFGVKTKGVSKTLAAVNFGLAISEIFKSPAVPFIEPFATITRLAQVVIASENLNSAFSRIDAAAGGGSFMTKGPQLLMVGDNPGGVERVDVTPVSGRGRTRVGNGGMIQLAGGGSVFTDGSIVANSMTDGASASQMNMPPIYVAVKEIREMERKIDSKVSVVEA